MPTGFTMGMSEHPRDYALEYRVITLRAEGLTLEQVATIVGRSRERVRQIERRYWQTNGKRTEVYYLWKLICEIWPPL